uniref:Uncharacterized protein n=1 Tax=Lactuca sativa TaxID=4236 RepID=A0A9R1WYE3_LACSA|nr:hypothetical protein LSAT_V11C800430360 [Lactuca sativa]
MKNALPTCLFTYTTFGIRTLIVTRTSKLMLWIVSNFVLLMLEVLMEGLTEAREVFPDSYHGYYCKSVSMYMRTRVGGNRILEPLFWHTCKSYTMSYFQHTFCRLNHDTHEVLANIGHAK